MEKYKLNVDVNTNSIERYVVTVEANDPEEAQDLVYEYFQEYPNGQDFLTSKLRIKEQVSSMEVIDVEFERKESNDRDVFA